MRAAAISPVEHVEPIKRRSVIPPMRESGEVIPFPGQPAQAQPLPCPQRPMRVLIVAIENRWGVARLPKSLVGSGFEVAGLCDKDNILLASSSVERNYRLPNSRSCVRLGAGIKNAMLDWRPTLVIPADEQVVALLSALLREDARRPIPGWTSEMRACLDLSLGNP